MVTGSKAPSGKAMVQMDSLYRHFVVSDEIIETYEKNFRNIDKDIKLLRFAAGSFGTISDAYILYALSLMGVATKESIVNVLRGYKRLHPELNIFDPTDIEGLRRRLVSFASNGIVFRHSYMVKAVNPKTNKPTVETVLLYTIEDAMLNFINNKLQTRVKLQKWIQAKPLEDLIGWAACSYCASCLCDRKELVDFKQCTFQTKSSGQVIMPMEVKLNTGKDDAYVAHISAFLHYNKSRQTPEMYEDYSLQTILKIRDYLEFRATRGQDPYVVIVCESSKDAEAMKKLIIDTKCLLEYTQRLYFTSEGIFRQDTPIEDKYLQMEESAKGDYEFVLKKPTFFAN